MARSREPGEAHRSRLLALLARGPQKPSELSWRARARAVWRTVVELFGDDLTDRAAALTYYSIMSIFPGLVVLLAVIGLLGDRATASLKEGVDEITFGPTEDIINTGIKNLQESQSTAGILAVIGVAVAFWSASSYVGAFMRAANAIYEVPEGRPMWKMLPVRLFVTALTGIFLAVSALAVVFTGKLAVKTGEILDIKAATVNMFNVIKWPVLVVLFGLLLALLYWAAPNARHGGFRWITPGSALAVLAWVAVSAGFAYYVTLFNSYNRTYGAIGGIIAFLVWVWLTNVTVLLGAEFDAELARARAIAAGLPPNAKPYVPLRDVPKQELPESIDDSADVGSP